MSIYNRVLVVSDTHFPYHHKDTFNFLKALNSGAITIEELLVTGLTLDEIRTRSFAKILKDRRLKLE